MKKTIAAVLFALPLGLSFSVCAQEPVMQEEETVVETVDDPYAQFKNRTPINVFNEGTIYLNKHDYVTALPYVQYAADLGVADAQYWTGFIYNHGSAGVKDDDLAIKYWQMASDQNNGLAQFYLGFLFHDMGDYINAIKYWELAAANNIAEAMTNIGLCYDEGRGVDCDEEQALGWFQRAADAGSYTGMYNLGYYNEYGKGGLLVDIDKAIEWYSKAWGLGHYNSKLAIDRLQSKQ